MDEYVLAPADAIARYQAQIGKGGTGKNAPATSAELERRTSILADDYDFTDTAVRRAQQLSGPTTTGPFAIPQIVPGLGSALRWTDPGKLYNQVATIKNRFGLDYLQKLRESGVTLGQVTEREHKILQEQLGALNVTSDEESLDRDLEEVRKTARRMLDYATQDYYKSINKPMPATPAGQSKYPTIQALPGFQPRKPTR
jgi:hypothetical protein